MHNNMIFNHQKDFESAEDFLHFFQNHHFFKTNNIWEANAIGRGGHIYRGQANADWVLKPTVFRKPDALRNYTPQIAGEYSGKNKLMWLGFHLQSEIRSVLIFLETADKLGIETPLDYSKVKEHYELISSAMNQNEYDYSTAFPCQRYLEDMALAQHHGIPTRLLDWTESPLIACFFAALGASSVTPDEFRVESSHISVICLNTQNLKESDDLMLVRAPRHRNNFLRIQKGLFTHIQNANSYFLENEEWPSLESVVQNSAKLSGSLKKYSLPSTKSDDLLRLLFDYHITKYEMMPTLDNIAQSHAYARLLFK